MNVFQRLALKAATLTGAFSKIDDNKAYQSYQYTGGFNFSKFDEQFIIDKGYAGNADLYAIINKISQTAAGIPLDLVEINSNGEEELITEGELYDLIQQPNRLQTRIEFVQESLMFLLLSGNSYTAGYRALGMGDQIRELNNLASQFMQIEAGDMANPINAYWYQEVYNTKYDANDVMHTRYPNPKGEGVDRLYGLSPLEAGNNALQSSNNTYEAKANIVKNSGVNGLISSNSERGLNAEQGKKMQDAWDNKNNDPKKFGRNLVTSAQVTFQQLGLSPDKLQLIEGSVQDLRSLCRIYSVDSKLFGDAQSSTHNNIASAKKSMYTDAVLPNLELWLGNFNNWFVNSWSVAENKEYCVKANTSEIEVLQADQKLEAEKDKVVTDTIMNVLNSTVSNDSKVQSLMYGIGMTEDEAKLIVGTEIIEDVN
jgi:HK97 family phage portal protein